MNLLIELRDGFEVLKLSSHVLPQIILLWEINGSSYCFVDVIIGLKPLSNVFSKMSS